MLGQPCLYLSLLESGRCSRQIFTASPRHRFTAEQTGMKSVTNREEREDLQRES